MLRGPENFYAEWRVRSGVAPSLHDEVPAPPPEQLLQAIWFHQRLLREQLQLVDGRAVQVLHPGFWNRESGPDFQQAVVQIAGEAPRSGDVEIDLAGHGWRAHRHDRNPAFKNVVLHVVWDGDEKAPLPTLVLKPFLDAPLNELRFWLGTEAAQAFPAGLTGKCCAPLRELPPERLRELLHQAALVRLQSKAAQLECRARQAGWEQALWEGLFRALGYKHNLWPMQRLAELRSQWQPGGAKISPLILQARLLGVGGLLPPELPRNYATTEAYVRRLWDCWWREQERFSDCTLPKSLWRFHGIRPANHPHRRLALATHWLAAGDLVTRVEKWLKKGASARAMDGDGGTHLLSIFQAPEDEFWSWHWNLRSARLSKAQPLIGTQRVTDLAVNVVLPWLWGRARQGGREAVLRQIEQVYLQWPAGEDNARLRLARRRLLGTESARHLRHAAAQQGLLQILRDFCEHSDSLCTGCRFPELVRDWQQR